MIPIRNFLYCFIFLLPAINPAFAIPTVLPEIQAYHSIGSRGSSYSTVAGGLAIQLSVQQIGPNRWLHLLGLYSPEKIGSARGKAAGWIFHSHGQGFEIGVFDQKRMVGYFKGANVALRHLEWTETHLGNKAGKTAVDTIHLGWTAGTKFMMLLGLDFTTLHTPEGSLMEFEIALGGRIAF